MAMANVFYDGANNLPDQNAKKLKQKTLEAIAEHNVNARVPIMRQFLHKNWTGFNLGTNCRKDNLFLPHAQIRHAKSDMQKSLTMYKIVKNVRTLFVTLIIIDRFHWS